MESCIFLLQDRVERINLHAIDHIIFIVHPSLALSQAEEELLRMARDFDDLSRKSHLFQKDL